MNLHIRVIEKTLCIAERTLQEAKEQGNTKVYIRISHEVRDLKLQILIMKGEI